MVISHYFVDVILNVYPFWVEAVVDILPSVGALRRERDDEMLQKNTFNIITFRICEIFRDIFRMDMN